MIPTDFQQTHIDQNAERRYALAKVYGLLIRLAEEAEYQTALPETITSEKEESMEPTPAQLVLL
jgi:hypothetical protein